MGSFIDLTGKRYGRLLVLEKAGRNAKGKTTWISWCVCGEKKIIAGHDLRRGGTRSCGCLRKEISAKIGAKTGPINAARIGVLNRLSSGEAAFNSLVYRYKDKARQKKLEWSLTKEDVRKLSQENCYYCGAFPFQVEKVKENTGNFVYNGLDRVDNTKGYFLNNVVPCCGFCNRAKGKKSLDEFQAWIANLRKEISPTISNICDS